MKKPLEWHLECLKNVERTLFDEERKLAYLHGNIDRLRADIAWRKEQIEQAKQRGLDEYDPERFYPQRLVNNPVKTKK